MEHTLSLAPRACLARQAESRLTLIGKLIHWPQGNQVQSKSWEGESGPRPAGQDPSWGAGPGGCGRQGLSQARPLGPKTEERFQLPLPRQPAGFLPTPRSFARIETCP